MYKPSKIVVSLMASDFLLQSGWGFVGPVFALFLSQRIEGVSIGMVGLAAGVYWITKSTAQPFIARAMDLIKGDKDDMNFLILGLVCMSFLSLGYIFATTIYHIFIIEFFRGLAQAFIVPAWLGMFTHYMDKDWRSFTWAIHSTSVGYALGFTAVFGGVIADRMGFQAVFLLVSASAMTSAIMVYITKTKNSLLLDEE